MGGHWILTNRSQSFELENTLYHKNWQDNTCVGAEAIVLLELMEVIKRKGQNICSRLITIGVDNRKVYHKVIEDILKPSIHVQDAGAEIVQIWRIISKINFTVDFKLVKGHSKQTLSFERRPLEHLIKQYDYNAKEI